MKQFARANFLPSRGGGLGAARAPVRFVLAAIPVAAVVAILFDVGSNLGRGYDITDEGSFLNALASPDDVVSATRADNYTRTLFHLAGGSVYGLRLLAAVILLLASVGFAAVLQRTVERGRSGPASVAERTATVGTISAAALAFYGPWIPTPSYNWMNLLACLVFASAILVTHRPYRAGTPRRPVRGDRWLAGAALAGAGGAASLLAKPTTAALLGLLWAAWVSCAGRAGDRIRLLVCSALTGSLFVALHVLAFEESPSAFVAGLRTAASLLAERDPDYVLRALVVRSSAELLAIPWMLFREAGFSLTLSFLTMLILGGRSLGVAWLLGGYPGSEPYARRALQLADESSARNAWVLTDGAGREEAHSRKRPRSARTGFSRGLRAGGPREECVARRKPGTVASCPAGEAVGTMPKTRRPPGGAVEVEQRGPGRLSVEEAGGTA